MAHEYEYNLRLEYPSMFPQVPATVRPRDADARLSAHQYGPGGPLCLEWRPDNWHAGVSGAQLLMSAHKLLHTENPFGTATGTQNAAVASAHRLSVGQQLRAADSWIRFYLPAALRAYLSNLGTDEVGELQFSVRTHEKLLVVFLRSAAASTSFAYWLPPDRVFRSFTFPGLLVTTSHATARLLEPRNAADLGEFLELPVAGQEWILAVSATKDPVLFSLSGDGEVSVGQNLEDEAPTERTPSQYTPLSTKSVAVVGLGSLGTKISIAFARLGVRQFVLVDDDVFLPGNIERNSLDWADVGLHKVTATRQAILRVAPSADVVQHLVRLTGQESSAVITGIASKLATCDLIVDATGNPRNFNICAAAAVSGARPMVWAEIFGGGKGGGTFRSIPGIDASPHTVRQGYLAFCETNPAPAGFAVDYDLHEDDQPVLAASDADVGVIAGHVVRIGADALLNDPPDHPYPIYLIGFARWWVFDGPFDTRPLTVQRQDWPTEGAGTASEAEAGAEFLKTLWEAKVRAGSSSQ